MKPTKYGRCKEDGAPRKRYGNWLSCCADIGATCPMLPGSKRKDSKRKVKP